MASAYFADFPPEALDAIRTTGLRNVAILTVPPVGSGAALAGVSSGIEPVFALRYIRRSESLSKEEFTVDHALVTRYRTVTGTGSADPLPPAFQTAHDILFAPRIAVQAAIQRHIDQGISSTLNLPRDTSPETVSRVYRATWEAGCKGITVYREGSREGILLTTKEAGRRQRDGVTPRLVAEINRLAGRVFPAATRLSQAPTDVELGRLAQAIDALLKDGAAQLQLLPTGLPLRPRPAMLTGFTLAQPAPEGNIQVTINEVEGEPFELICHGGKAGSDILAWVQAIARTASILLRLQRLPSPSERLQLLIEQWEGIAGSRSIGFGPNRVRSGPDGMAQALQRYLALKGPASSGNGDPTAAGLFSPADSGHRALPPTPPDAAAANGNFCPVCHGLTLITGEEAGCVTCASCSYKEC